MKKYLAVYILVALLIAVQSINVAATSIQNTDMLPSYSNPVWSDDGGSIGGSVPATKQPSDPYDSMPDWVHDCENHTHFYPDQALSAAGDSSLNLYVVLCRTLNVRPTPGTQEARIG